MALTMNRKSLSRVTKHPSVWPKWPKWNPLFKFTVIHLCLMKFHYTLIFNVICGIFVKKNHVDGCGSVTDFNNVSCFCHDHFHFLWHSSPVFLSFIFYSLETLSQYIKRLQCSSSSPSCSFCEFVISAFNCLPMLLDHAWPFQFLRPTYV